MFKMDFSEIIDVVKEKAQSGADFVGSKLEGVAEVIRLKDEITAAELEIDQYYIEAGKKAVATKMTLVAPEIWEIDRLKSVIADNQATLEEIVAKNTAQEEETEPRKRVKYCSECGAKVKAGAKFCPDCGTKLV